MREINLICPVGQTGYGVTGRGMFRGLQQEACNVSWFPIGQPKTPDAPGFETQIMKCHFSRKGYNPQATSYRMFHEFDLNLFPAGTGVKIGNPVFELNRIPKKVVELLNVLDVLCVPSEWQANILRDHGVFTPVHTVPHGIDTDVFSRTQVAETRLELPINESHAYQFIHIGKFEKRKAQEELIQAFLQEFNADEPVRLVLLSDNPFLPNRKAQELQERFGNGRVVFHQYLEKHEYVSNWIQSNGDCAVFPARAEGWNLCLHECMALGLPVICQNVTGHTAYVNEQNAILMEAGNLVDAHDGIWFHGQGQWHDVNVESLQQCMRQAFNRGRRINRAGMETGRRLTWQNAARTLLEVIDGL